MRVKSHIYQYLQKALLLYVMVLGLASAGAISVNLPALADRTDPDFVPPEITLPMGGGMTSQPAQAPQPSAGQPVPGQSGGNQGGYPGFQMPGQLGGTPGMTGQGMNPFIMKGADRMRQPPGTHFASKGMQPPAAGQPGAPPAGSSAFMQQPNQMGQGGATLSTEAHIADPTAMIVTNKGNIEIRLFRQYAPKTVAAFIQMVHEGFYNGLTWHRVVPGFVIQGGCPIGNGTGNYPAGSANPRFLPLEVSPKVSHNAAGVVAMARQPGNVNSASCQFYITLKPQPRLDGQYTVFGGVTKGLEVVNAITVGDKIIQISVSE